MHKPFLFILIFCFIGCYNKKDTVKPIISPITESVYASGIIKSKQQYQAFSTVSGTIKSIYLKEGDKVDIGTPILSITNEIQQLNIQNAKLSAQYADLSNNRGKLDDAHNLVMLQQQKMKNDSLLLKRQQNIWQQNGGTKVQLEERELAYEAAKVDYRSALQKYNDLRKQLDFAAKQSKKNLQISEQVAKDFILRSEVKGLLYQLYKKNGEAVNPQMPLALVGADKQFVLEMQVDEYDIFKIKKGQTVLVTLDSYKGKVFEAKITTVSPMMDEDSKTFLVEAVFINPPEKLYPFISFEANIIIHTKPKALLIPVACLLNDSTVVKTNGQQVKVKTGLRDYRMVEIIKGITTADELKYPNK